MNSLALSPLRARLLAGHERHGASAPIIDLGVEPPIEPDGREHTASERRRVSLRWLCATILTGVAGAAFIGGAIRAALDKPSLFPEPPELAAVKQPTSMGRSPSQAKGDRLVRPVDIVAAKQTFRAPTTVTVGNRRIVETRTFTRVSTTLSMTSLGLADKVPPFNPLRLIEDSGPRHAAEARARPAPDKAEVSFEIKDLAQSPPLLSARALTTGEAQAQIAEFMRARRADSSPNPPIPPQLMLMRTSRLGLDSAGGLGYANASEDIGQPSPFSSIEVRMVPENVTVVPKSPASATPSAHPSDVLVAVRHGQTLADILSRAGASDAQIAKAIAAFGFANGQSPVSEGQRVRLRFIDDGGGKNRRLAAISIYTGETLQASVALNDAGQWAPVRKSPHPDETKRPGRYLRNSAPRMTLYESFYQTALKQGVPKATIDELIQIFANSIDFKAPVSGGDSFDIFYQRDRAPNRDELLYASITARGQTHQFYRYKDAGGVVDYYDAQGRSSHRFLLRKPLLGGRLSSPFGMRFHPILGIERMHTGVDWAAPIGTPIFATGDGVVIKAGVESGYGNRIEIQHANGYVTTYNHLQGFARGIHVGTRVKQGQIIAFLGMTGLSTGPHIHYEVIVNGHFVDPMKVKLARTRILSGGALAQFERDRSRIVKLMASAPDATRVDPRHG